MKYLISKQDKKNLLKMYEPSIGISVMDIENKEYIVNFYSVSEKSLEMIKEDLKDIKGDLKGLLISKIIIYSDLSNTKHFKELDDTFSILKKCKFVILTNDKSVILTNNKSVILTNNDKLKEFSKKCLCKVIENFEDLTYDIDIIYNDDFNYENLFKTGSLYEDQKSSRPNDSQKKMIDEIIANNPMLFSKPKGS